MACAAGAPCQQCAHTCLLRLWLYTLHHGIILFVGVRVLGVLDFSFLSFFLKMGFAMSNEAKVWRADDGPGLQMWPRAGMGSALALHPAGTSRRDQHPQQTPCIGLLNTNPYCRFSFRAAGSTQLQGPAGGCRSTEEGLTLQAAPPRGRQACRSTPASWPGLSCLLGLPARLLRHRTRPHTRVSTSCPLSTALLRGASSLLRSL